MSITTKTGDRGTTGLFGGGRISKSSDLIEAIGDIDELNSIIGVVRSMVETNGRSSLGEIDQILEYIQNCCFVIGAQIASSEAKKTKMMEKIKIEDEDVGKLERYIEKLENQLPELHNFILPGSHPVASQLFLARAICRRAERSLVRLNKSELLVIIKFTNRLSDLLFLIARFINQAKNKKETFWSKI